MRKRARVLLIICQLLTACSAGTMASTQTQTPRPVTPTVTATPMPPIAVVGGSVPCYRDVSSDAEVLTTMEIGDELIIFGNARGGQYLAVQPETQSGYCWLPSEFVTIIGSTEQLPRLVPTPLPPPRAPRNFVGVADCRIPERRAWESSIFAVLTWEDVQDETGYVIFRGDSELAVLPADQVHYEGIIEPMTHIYVTGAAAYTLQAYNDSGTSEGITVIVDYSCSIHNK